MSASTQKFDKMLNYIGLNKNFLGIIKIINTCCMCLLTSDFPLYFDGMRKISLMLRTTLKFPTSTRPTFAVTLSITSNTTPRYLENQFLVAQTFNAFSTLLIFYQLGLKYTMHGILTLTDLTDSNVLLSSKIWFSNCINSRRLSLVCTEYFEGDILSATQT